MNNIDGKTKLVGLFGWPVEHTFSPLLHNSAFEELGLNYVYMPLPVNPEKLGDAVDGIRALNFEGVNVTIPHKEKVMQYLDEIDEAAQLIGAVNTIVNKDGKLKGYNTDGPGFVDSLKQEKNYDLKGKRMLLIGAGGAAKAVAVQAALSGLKEIVLANRSLEKAAKLEETLKKTSCSVKLIELDKVDKELVKDIDVIVDSSPVGMHPKEDVPPVIPADILHSGLLVCDLVYNPEDTTLLKAAKNAGAETWSGLGMLIHQGALAFQYWTGKQAPIDIMTQAIRNYLHERRSIEIFR